VLNQLRQLAESTDEELTAATSAPGSGVEREQLRYELVVVRRRLPDAMRLRECLAVIRGLPFTIDLTPGDGLEI
jgi:hypothetical protein